jgi:two-component system LytT family response regulator
MGSRIVVKSGNRTLFLRPEQIEWIEAEKDHVRFHQGTESFLVRSSMSALSRLLDPSSFMRVHRSTLVNLDHVREMRPLNSGDYEILMNNDVRLTLSRGYRTVLQRILQTWGVREPEAKQEGAL